MHSRDSVSATTAGMRMNNTNTDRTGTKVTPAQIVHVINVCNVYKKFSINAFVIFVNIYYCNKCHMKWRKSFIEQLE